MFSPWYALAQRRGAADPFHHCALNVALYGPRRRWSLTERGRGAVRRDATRLEIGPSALHWDGTALTIRIEEVAAPIPARIRGTVRVHPAALTGSRFALDPGGRHRWAPLAPTAQVEVALESPSLRWSGPGYLDTNDGDAPLQADFVDWHWCRAPLPDGGAAVLYEVACRGAAPGATETLALRFGAAGGVRPFPPPPRAALPPTLWRVARPTRCDPGATPAVRRTLEDTPFYARSVIDTRLDGEDVTAMHESLSLDRFRAPWVQAMLPFRVPRRAG